MMLCSHVNKQFGLVTILFVKCLITGKTIQHTLTQNRRFEYKINSKNRSSIVRTKVLHELLTCKLFWLMRFTRKPFFSLFFKQ